MAPLRDWAPRGKRLHARVPYGHWKTLTFIAALRCDRVDAPCVFDGPINRNTFLAYVTQFLIPTLVPRDIVVLDNLGSHKSQAVRKAIRAAGARLLFLPAYSPDLNPINRSSPSSSISCARPQSGPSRRPGSASARCSTTSRQTPASDTSLTQATLQPKVIRL